MDSITSLIKAEIKKQYGSVAKFAEASGIPYGTVSNSLARGVGGTAYDTVSKMCKFLHIKQAYDDDLILFNQEFYDVYKKLTALDEMGVHTVCSVLNVEYQRCQENDDPTVKGYNGIFLYTLNLYLVKCRQHHGSAFGWTIPTKHHSRQQKTF